MVFKTIISFICGLYRFYPVLPSFAQFYPTGFTHWVKLPCQPWLQLSLVLPSVIMRWSILIVGFPFVVLPSIFPSTTVLRTELPRSICCMLRSNDVQFTKWYYIVCRYAAGTWYETNASWSRSNDGVFWQRCTTAADATEASDEYDAIIRCALLTANMFTLR